MNVLLCTNRILLQKVVFCQSMYSKVEETFEIPSGRLCQSFGHFDPRVSLLIITYKLLHTWPSFASTKNEQQGVKGLVLFFCLHSPGSFAATSPDNLETLEMSAAEIESSTVLAAASILGVIAISDSGSESELPMPNEDRRHFGLPIYFCLGALISSEVSMMFPCVQATLQ